MSLPLLHEAVLAPVSRLFVLICDPDRVDPLEVSRFEVPAGPNIDSHAPHEI